MARTSKKDKQLQDELAALVEPDYKPTTTLERDAPANLRRLEFDKLKYGYDTIGDESTRTLMQDAAVEINQRRRRAAEDIFYIGVRLLEIEAAIPKQFWTWVAIEFDYSEDTAREFMNVARKFADSAERVLDVPPSVLRLIASPKVPAAAVDAVLEAVEDKRLDGGRLRVAEAEEIVDQFRPEEKKRGRRERIARTIAGTYSVQKTDDVVVKTLVEAPPDNTLAEAVSHATRPQLEKAISLLTPDDTGRRQVLEHAVDKLEKHAPAESDSAFQAPAISTRKKESVVVELPRALWGKIAEAFKQFDMNPVLSDKEAGRILKAIEHSLETQ